MRSGSASRALLGLCSVAAALVLALGAPVSHGEEKPLWEFGMGAGAIAFPDYRGSDETQVYPVPVDIDKEVARLKLESLGVQIDTLSDEQRAYLASWDMGT